MLKRKPNNNLEKYLHPGIYEAEYGKYIANFPLFIGLKKTGEVLDLACSTGYLTIPLARAGLK